jgi:hypothetical protein
LTWRLGVDRSNRDAIYSVAYFRSFVPSFGFGGTIQNQELSGSVRAPFARRRAYWVGGLAWRINQPVTPGESELHTVWLQTSVGYVLNRRLQLEGFYTDSVQETGGPAGRLNRNQIGIQLVTASPMRVR